MSEFKGTPGHRFRDKYGHIVDESGKDVLFRGVSIACAGSSVPEAEKNSDLIAAAPDLLDALQKIMGAIDRCEAEDEASLIDEFTEEMETSARAAIAKALNTDTTER